MRRQAFLVWSIVLIVAWLAAGCTSPQSTPASAVPTSPTAALPLEASPSPGSTAQGTGSTASSPIRCILIPEKSEARYRVREQLANLNLPSDAIGRTKDISGTVVIGADGAIDPSASEFVVAMSTLTSDRSQRDNFLRRNVLQTDQYPNVVFVPTRVSGLPWPLPQSGDVNFQVIGNLTIRDVTKEVTWVITGTIQGDQATGLATTSFTFEDFNLNQPHVSVVLSIEDHIGLEVDVALQRLSGQ